MAYPLSKFMEDKGKHTITYFQAIATTPQLIAADLVELANLDVRWEPRINGLVSTPNEFKEYAEKERETSVQRDIYRAKKITLRGTPSRRVEWVDMEVPVDYIANTRRRTCPDLVGYDKTGKTYIVDLKFQREEKTDTPIVGIYKTIYYALCAKKNAKNLRDYHIFHKKKGNYLNVDFLNGKPIYEDPIAVLVANNEYWNHWGSYLNNTNRSCLIQIVNATIQDCGLTFQAYKFSDYHTWIKIC